MFRNKKGFTLVELLAVIVILAIILAIAIPSITSLTSNAKADAFEANVKLILKGMEYANLQSPGSVTAGDKAIDTIDDYGATVGDYEALSTYTVAIDGNGVISISSLETATGGKFSGCSITGSATYTSTTVSCG